MLSSKNVTDDAITTENPRFLSKAEFELENRRTQVQRGDLLMTIVGTVGRVAVVPEELQGICLQRSVAVLKPKHELITPRYLMYQLQSMQSFLEQEAHGVAQKGIYLKQVEQLNIRMQEIAEQQKIVDHLDKVSALISLRKQQIAKLDELVKARFVEMFGDPVQNPMNWVAISLMEMGYCKNGMNFHTGDSGVVLRCLGVGDFKDLSVIGRTDILPTVSLNEMPPDEYMLQNGDIVFVRSNGNKALVGRCLMFFPHATPTTYSGFCIRYRLTSDRVDAVYLLHVLKTKSMREKMTGRGGNIQNLNQQILSTLNIPIPPLALQHQFAAFVAQTEQQKLTIQHSLAKMELLKKALIQKYFE